MKNAKKFFGKQKKTSIGQSSKKKKKNPREIEVNKKSLFNRYKNAQKVEEELEKKRKMEQKFKRQLNTYSESDEEEDAYNQLVSCFSNTVNRSNAESDEESISEVSNNEEELETELQCVKKPERILGTDDEEAESGREHDIELVPEFDEDDKEDTLEDPFTKHLKNDLADEMIVSLSNTLHSVDVHYKTWSTIGNMIITIPKPVETLSNKIKPKVSILEDKPQALPGTVPQLLNTVDFHKLFIKSQIHANIVSANKSNLIKRDLELNEVFTPLQKELFSILNNYQDLYYADRSFSNADEIRYVYCLHVINHMLKTRGKILHHNAKLTKKKNDLTDDYRDQGLVRPRVLIIVPFKNAAYRVVKTLTDILVPKEAGQVLNKKRFQDDFTGGELILPRKNPKPEDYELLFTGNTDDTFRLGMSMTKKSLKLYTDFYSSDIIIASPLGLRMLVGAEGEDDRDYDFLASIEILIMDQSDVFLMQNWDHLLHVLSHFHLQPKNTHDTDYSRVRSWAVNGWAQYYRQSIIFSSILMPQIKSVMNKNCNNYAGKVLVENPVDVGAIQQVMVQVPQIFHRFNATSPLASTEARFDYFIKEILPKQRDTLMSHTLIYVPSYFDYVKLRNYLKKEDISFVQICEYSKDGKIARARDMFFHTEAHFLLYSERVHFFRRFRVKGIRHIIFYQPPTYPHFYSEMCNLMQESNQNKYGGSECNMTVTVLYCKYDLVQLSGILGTNRAARTMRSDKSVHMYMTGIPRDATNSAIQEVEARRVAGEFCGVSMCTPTNAQLISGLANYS